MACMTSQIIALYIKHKLKSELHFIEQFYKLIDIYSIQVGDSGVGKTCVVKLLAQLTGHKLVNLTVNSDMDVTELLGGFQQVRNIYCCILMFFHLV